MSIVPFDFAANVPAYLRQDSLVNTGNSLLAGLPSGSWPRISIRGRQFHLVSATGDETHLQTLQLDIIMVDSNPNLSKRFYPGGYDPTQEARAPDCYSDNGVGPSARSTVPQAQNCSQCPNNVWGSRINPQTGASAKACSDLKKIAVCTMLNDVVDPTIYELDVPAASLKLLNEFGRTCAGKGVPPTVVVVTLGFVQDAAFPQLTFAPKRFISEKEALVVKELRNTEPVRLAIGAGDLPGTAQLNAPITQQVIVAPQPAQPQTFVQNPLTDAPKLPETLGSAEPAKPRRGRPAKGAVETASPAVAQQTASQEFFPQNQTAQPVEPAASVVQNPQLSDPALDALLAGIL